MGHKYNIVTAMHIGYKTHAAKEFSLKIMAQGVNAPLGVWVSGQ